MKYSKLILFIKSFISLNNPIRLFYHYIRWIMAFYFYWNPSRDMIVIWVTWTKWKTTTTDIIARWLINDWKRVFMFSTVSYIIWDKEYENKSKMTNDSPFVLQNLLKKAKDAWCKYAVLETSSHGIYYNRNYWIDYDVVVFTNLSQDHLDLHGTMEEYANIKYRLFENIVKYRRKPWVKKVSVINIDNSYSHIFLNAIADNIYTYWLNQSAQIRAQNIEYKKDFTKFEIKIPSNTIHVKTKLKWEFNIYNILAATSVLISQKISLDSIIKTIEIVSWIPGRLEEVSNNRGFKIFIDYAHTEESLKSVLETIKKMEWIWRIITIFW
jgi:UDP-N-acetylmuramoyl-L-alanyl-D-glutamate--2,6-diaminopimelate ligase